MEERIYFVYLYTWDDGAVYVGQSKTTSCRYGYISPYKNSKLVYNKMKKHPDYKKEILKDNLSQDEVDYWERFFIKKYNSLWSKDNTNGLNLTEGGQQSHVDSYATRELKRKNQLGNKNSMYGKTPWNKGTKGLQIAHNRIKTYVKDTQCNTITEFDSIEAAFVSIGYTSGKSANKYLNKDKMAKNRYYIYTREE